MSQTDLQDQTDDTTDSSTVTSDDNAVSSPANEEATPSITDAVLAALEPKEASPASEDEPGSEDTDTKGEEPAETKDTDKSEEERKDEEFELSEKEMAALNDKTRNRIETLLTQRREKAELVERFEKEVESLRPEAESYRKVTQFMRDNNLAPQDAGQALRLAGLMQTDPMAAFEELKPIMARLAEASGSVLPQDLADDVRAGKITQGRALELAKSRAQETLSRRTLEDGRKREAEAAQQAQQRQHLATMVSAGDALAASRAQTDPDWKLKEPLVVDKLKLDIGQNGIPKDKADLTARFDRIVNEVTTYLRTVAPAKTPEVKPKASVSSTEQKLAPPKSAHEAVMRALGE